MSKQKQLCKLSLTYGILSDSSWIEARETDQGFAVAIWVEEIIPEALEIGSIQEKYNWRLFCNFLMKLCDTHLEVQPQERDVWKSIAVRGETGLAADCLRIAWANANASDSVLNWLLSMDERSFNFIDTNFQLIENPDDYDLLDQVLELITFTGCEKGIVNLLEAKGLKVSHKSIVKLIEDLESNKTIEEEQKERIKKQAIAPFRNEIDRISKHFSDERRRIGCGISGSKPSLRAIVRTWLEGYVAEHGYMPDGSHEVSIPFLGGRTTAGTVNFSNLRGLD